MSEYFQSVLGYDFAILWAAGKAVLQGQSPYAIDGFFYPLSFAYFMVLFALFPVRLAHVQMVLLSLVSFSFLKPRKRVLLFAPIFYGLFIGQVDLLLLSLGLAGGWVGLAISTLKPQVGIWLLIFQFYNWRRDQRTKIAWTLALIAVLYGLPFLASPSWVSEWMAASPGVLDYSSHSASLFGIGRLVPIPWLFSWLLVALIGMAYWIFTLRSGWLWDRYWESVTLFNPFSHVYAYGMLYARVDNVVIGLSWFLLVIRFILGSGLPMTVIPLYILIKERVGEKQGYETMQNPA